MDYTKTCQGWIYCITNKVNGKRYIGQTNNYERRKREHFCSSVTWCPALHSAITKYGSSNFIMEPVVTFTAINRTVCVDIMNKLEIFYISKFKTLTHQNGYNINIGGQGNTGFKHTEEAKKLISEKLTGRKMPKEFGDVVRARHPEVTLPDNKRGVWLYDLSGWFAREYSSITEAMRALNKVNAAAKANIRNALKDPSRQAYGYLWRYKEEKDFPLFIDSYNKHKGLEKKEVYYYTLDKQLIGKFPSACDAAKQTGISLTAIESSLKSERQGRKRKSNYWSHIPPEMQVSVC